MSNGNSHDNSKSGPESTNMLSVAPTPIFTWDHDHRPHVSSPLSSSPIRASSPLSPVDRNTSTQRQIQSSPIPPPRFKYASRPTRQQNPLLRKREDVQESRRRSFLQSVREKSDDMAWKRRDIEGQFLKNSMLADIGRLSRDAPVISEADIEDATTVSEENVGQQDDDMAEAYAEDEQLEAMVASYEEQQRQTYQRPQSPALSDADYDDVFAELIAQEQAGLQLQSSGEQMDMS